MIDTLALISYGGEVLWQHTTHESGRRAVINRLIQDVLLEDRISERAFTVEDVKLYWSLQNEAKFFAVAACPKFLVTHYVEDFLREVVQAFTKRLLHARRDGGEGPINFADECNQMMQKLEASEAEVAHGGPQLPAGPNMDDEDDESAEDGAAALEDTDDARAEETSIASPEAATPSGGGHREGGVFVTKDGRRIATRGGGRGGGAAASANSGKDAQTRKKRPAKAPTTWDDGPVNDPAVAAQASASGPSAEDLQAQTELQRATYVKRLANGAAAPVKEKEWEGQSRGRLANWLRSYVGTREVDEGDLQKVIPSLREKLIAKNVAVEVAEHVCGSVESSLAGKRLGTFDSVYTTVETAMTTALQRILQPKREVNVLRDVAAAKARMKPYSIVFCGVNGVGKSTSLAKITYWLQQNNFSVLLAAGDTFRHGAVEQLEVHGRCLGAQVFQMGYGSDPSAVASAAIAHASRQHTDVVMIDTAGRMQDHESRMRALAKLIHDNQPDLVLFVGEALVGNNGVDQLRKFNQCLIDFAPVGAAHRGIDGIVLTKFDTIDDKVGAALSMVYELGQPIVFVGVGQTYQDLKVIEPEVVVSALMQ